MNDEVVDQEKLMTGVTDRFYIVKNRQTTKFDENKIIHGSHMYILFLPRLGLYVTKFYPEH
jgi:hypothetical protein